MKSRELQKLWYDWLSASEKLLRLLYEQTAALTLRDVARIERLQPEIERQLKLVREIDEAALAKARSLAIEFGVEPNLTALAGKLDKAESQALQQLGNKVVVGARHVQDVVAKNRRLMENEMVFINGTLTLIAKAAVQSSSPYTKSSRTSVLVDQAA